MASDRMKRASEWFYKMLYREETITPPKPAEKGSSSAKTAPSPLPSVWVEPPRPAITTVLLPKELRAMRSMARDPRYVRLSQEELFVRQGQLLADYEDSFPFEQNIVRYYPTYQALRDSELRGYFTWRAAWRRGERKKTSLSFAFLYVYELLNQIGVNDPVEGYERLRGFQKEYSLLDDKITAYVQAWLKDYIIYYRLDPVLLEGREELAFDRQLSVLLACDTHKEREVMDAVMALSSYRVDRSRLYQEKPEIYTEITVRTLRKMAAYYAKNRKQTLWEHCFGAITASPYTMFSAAVFYAPPGRPDSDYHVTPLCCYSCRRGRWTVREISGGRARNKKLGDIVKTVDAMLREKLGVGNAIQPGLSTKWIVKLIDEEIDAFEREKKAAEARRVTIDFSRLTAIRADAAITREKLIVDEEAEEPALPAQAEITQLIPPVSDGEAASEENCTDENGLDEDEKRLLACLLYGRSLDWVRQQGLLLEVLCDSVNEKLFDRFGDTVLTVEETPELIEDYIDELKEMIPA